MNRKKNMLIGTIALSLVVSTSAIAFAATDSSNTQQKKAMPAVMAGMTAEQRDAIHQARTDSMQEAVAELAGKGTITKDIADKLTADKILPRSKDKGGICALTEEQRVAREQAAENLVDSGAITREEADAVTSMPKLRMMSRSGEGCNLTDEQRTALGEAVKAKLESKLADLADAGAITQDQANQFLNDPGALPMGRGGRGHGGWNCMTDGQAM